MKHAWILGALCCAALTAVGQEIDGHAPLELDRWGKLESGEVGQSYFVEGRWLECSGSEVILVDLTADQRGFLYIDANSRLQRRLTQDLTPDGTPLFRRKSKARVFGKATKRGAQVVLEVSRVEVMTSDSERLVSALNALTDQGPEAYAGLADEARELAERYDDADLRTLAQQIARRQAQVEADRLDAKDADGAIALSQRMLAAKDRLGAIAVLARAEIAATDDASGQKLRAKLKELGATKSGGQWRSQEAFKTAEGFVRKEDGQWVRPEALELKAVIEQELADQEGKLVIVRQNPVEASRAASAGRLKRGQNAAEARIAAGMPVRVSHVKKRNALGEDVTWTQWITRDGRRAYFMNGDLVRAIPADTPWPKPKPAKKPK